MTPGIRLALAAITVALCVLAYRLAPAGAPEAAPPPPPRPTAPETAPLPVARPAPPEAAAAARLLMAERSVR